MASNADIEREEDRDRGILSGADRKWLLMDRDDYVEQHSRQYWGQRRDEVIARSREAIRDLSLLFDHLDQEHRKAIINRGGVWPLDGSVDDPDFESNVLDSLAFLFELSGGTHKLDRPDRRSTFDRVFESAWQRLAWRYGYSLRTVDLTVDGDRIPHSELKKRAEAGEQLSIEEQVQLLIAYGDDVDPVEVQEQLRPVLFDEEE